MSLHTWCCQGPHKPSSCTPPLTLNFHWGRAATGKKNSYIYVCRVNSVMSNSLQSCRLWPVRLLCHGDSPGKNTGAYWPIHIAIPFSVQFSSVAQSCLTLCDHMDHSTPGHSVHHQLLELTQTHVHRVGDAIQPSHPLSSPSPPTLKLSQHQGLFK